MSLLISSRNSVFAGFPAPLPETRPTASRPWWFGRRDARKALAFQGVLHSSNHFDERDLAQIRYPIPPGRLEGRLAGTTGNCDLLPHPPTQVMPSISALSSQYRLAT